MVVEQQGMIGGAFPANYMARENTLCYHPHSRLMVKRCNSHKLLKEEADTGCGWQWESIRVFVGGRDLLESAGGLID